MEAGHCIFGCGREIDPERDYRKVVGYEQRREQGGTNALRLRQPTNEWACCECVDKAARGIAPAQVSLLV